MYFHNVIIALLSNIINISFVFSTSNGKLMCKNLFLNADTGEKLEENTMQSRQGNVTKAVASIVAAQNEVGANVTCISVKSDNLEKLRDACAPYGLHLLLEEIELGHANLPN